MIRCPREENVLAAATRGWTSPEDIQIAAHAAECSRCVAVMTDAAAVREEYAGDLASARVPSPAVVWWRLERRLREDRARAARRALTIAHGVAGAIITGVVLAIAQAVLPWVRPAAGSAWSAAVRILGGRPDWLELPASWNVPLALMVLLVMVLAPTALYLGLGRTDDEPRQT
jgi:hypothetical protein